MTAGVLLEGIDLDFAPVPARTMLAAVAPQGAGTHAVESLTSLMMRLAGAHHLATGALLTRSLGPVGGLPRAKPSDLLRDCRYANGVGRQAGYWAGAVETAAGLDVRNLALLPWASVLPSLELVDGYIRHCPDCLNSFAEAGTVYEPLLWVLPLVRVCADHDIPLEDRCPSCGHRQEAISFRGRPGICRRCANWLGRSSERRPAISEWDTWVSLRVGELVHAPQSAPDPSEVAAAVREALGEVGGSHGDIANAIGISPSSLSKWQNGQGRPSLTGALRICALGQWKVGPFFTGRLVHAPGIQSIEPSPWHGRVPKDWRAVARSARRLARSDPPPTLRAVATQLRVDIRSFRCHLPDLAATIVETQRRWASGGAADRLIEATALIEQIVAALTETGVEPSRRAVEARLPKPLSLREPALQAAWKGCKPVGHPANN